VSSKRTALYDTLFVENLSKSCFLFAFSPTKLLATFRPVKELFWWRENCLLILKHFDSKGTNFGAVLPNSRKRLRSVCYSVGEINRILFLRLVLQQWA